MCQKWCWEFGPADWMTNCPKYSLKSVIFRGCLLLSDFPIWRLLLSLEMGALQFGNWRQYPSYGRKSVGFIQILTWIQILALPLASMVTYLCSLLIKSFRFLLLHNQLSQKSSGLRQPSSFITSWFVWVRNSEKAQWGGLVTVPLCLGPSWRTWSLGTGVTRTRLGHAGLVVGVACWLNALLGQWAEHLLTVWCQVPRGRQASWERESRVDAVLPSVS